MDIHKNISRYMIFKTTVFLDGILTAADSTEYPIDWNNFDNLELASDSTTSEADTVTFGGNRINNNAMLYIVIHFSLICRCQRELKLSTILFSRKWQH